MTLLVTGALATGMAASVVMGVRATGMAAAAAAAGVVVVVAAEVVGLE
jgi:hypothetical protein